MKKLFEVGFMLMLVMILILSVGCSSTNLNGMNARMSGVWTKGSPFDAETPGKIELGAGTASVTIIPMARGQGAEFRAATYELFSGHALFYEEVVIYPVGQDGMMKLKREPQSILKIPWLIDIKAGEDKSINPTKIEFIPSAVDTKTTTDPVVPPTTTK